MRAVSAEPLAQRVYRLLADRKFHSGTALANASGVTRSAIWKTIAALSELGVPVHAVRRRGYRMPEASAPLEVDRIVVALPHVTAAHLRRGECVWSTGSTNADLLQRSDLTPGRFDFLVAEYQSAGRGRRGRSWHAPPGGAVCLSLSWMFPNLPRDAGALGLVIGVCALRVLRDAGVPQVQLKWPNDLVASDGKLGGILIELRAESAGPAFVVIGIGLNVALGAAVTRRVQATGTRPIDLDGLGVKICDRNLLCSSLISASIQGLEEFQSHGFAPFAAEWRAADVLAGKLVRVRGDGGSVSGHARGIDLHGALCVQTRDGLARFVGGEVSVRREA